MALTREEIRELSRILNQREFKGELAKKGTTVASLSKPPRPRKKGKPRLSVVIPSPVLPDPPGFEDAVAEAYGDWIPTTDPAERERRRDVLWDAWLAFLEERCPTSSTDPYWSYRYKGPNTAELLDRLPELAARRRRRFGTKYCRLVRDHGKAVSA